MENDKHFSWHAFQIPSEDQIIFGAVLDLLHMQFVVIFNIAMIAKYPQAFYYQFWYTYMWYFICAINVKYWLYNL